MFKKALIVTLMVILAGWTPMVSAGQCFVQRQVVVPDHCEQRVVQHHNVQRVVQHHNHNVQVVEKIKVNQKLVEFDADYFLGEHGYYEVVDELRQEEKLRQQKLQNQVIEKQQQQIDQLLKIVQELVKKKVETKPEPQPKPKEVPQNPNPPVPQPVNPEPVNPASDILDLKVFRIFKANCASCHNENNAKAGLKLVGGTSGSEYLFNLSLEDRVLVYDHTAGINLQPRGKKLMPLGGPALGDTDVELLRLWMIKEAERLKKQG